MSKAIFRMSKIMRRFQKNKSTVQKQEFLSVSDMTVQQKKK